MRKITKEEFVCKANKVHNHFYDYEKSNYINYDTKLLITCPIHGDFWQTPGNHLKGKGCLLCNGRPKDTKESFIEKAKKIWGNRFNYDKVEYINSITKILIIDKDGTEYWQRPNNHLSGFDPAKKSAITKEDFIKEARKIHGNIYDYSKIDIQKNEKKVTIICPIHGPFSQTIYNHLNGKGCKKCAIEKNAKKETLTTKDFIEKAKKIHNDKYDYTKVVYKKSTDIICIRCPKHGYFFQEAESHLQGHGCPKCAGKIKKTTEEFINAAKKVHGEKYNYKLTKYVNNHTKVKITCPKHGIFEQIPSNHLHGQGCPTCGKKKRIKETKLYEILKNRFNDTTIIHSFWNKHQEYDIFFPEYKIAVEYQGIQHFMPIDFAGYGMEKAKKIFKANKNRDRKKLQKSQKDNITLFYFSDLQYKSLFGKKIYNNIEELIKDIKEKMKS